MAGHYRMGGSRGSLLRVRSTSSITWPKRPPGSTPGSRSTCRRGPTWGSGRRRFSNSNRCFGFNVWRTNGGCFSSGKLSWKRWSRTGVNIIKLFSFVADAEAQQARVFVLGNPFQSGLRIWGQVQSQPNRSNFQILPSWKVLPSGRLRPYPQTSN